MRLDTTVNFRCRATDLATLVHFWLGQGAHPRSRGELVRVSLEFLIRELAKQNLVVPVTETSKALEILDQLFNVGFQGTNLALNLNDEEAADAAADALEKIMEKING